MITNDRAASNLGSVAMVKEAPTCGRSWIYSLVLLSLNKVIGLWGSSLSKFVFYIFWEIFLLLLSFFFVILFVWFCDLRKKAPLTWKKLINDQILFCEMDKKLRNCLHYINVFMISWAVEVNQVGTIMAKEGEDINSAVLIRTTK